MGSIEQRVEQLEREQIIQKEDLLRLRQLNEQQLQEASKVLGESRLAQEWARRQYRVDHDGWIWRWDLDRKAYVKTTNRVNTPVIPYNKITTKHLVDKAVSRDKLSQELQDFLSGAAEAIDNMHSFQVFVVKRLPVLSPETEKGLYLLETDETEEVTELLQEEDCDYNTVNEYDEINEPTMANRMCFKLAIEHDKALMVNFTGSESTVFSIRAIKEVEGRLMIVSNRETNVTLAQLATELSANNHTLPWAADADYLYVWIADTQTNDTLSVYEVTRHVIGVDYEKLVITGEGSEPSDYHWVSLGFVNHIEEELLPLEPVSSVDAMWEEENNE